ncbi:MAG: hypothetical protein ACKO1W_08615 [Microcystaceae cyanobacterium]
MIINEVLRLRDILGKLDLRLGKTGIAPGGELTLVQSLALGAIAF